jgi:predicted N-acetyltransferase YhbS
VITLPFSIRLATAADDKQVGELLVSAFVSSYARKLPQVVVSEKRKEELRNVSAKRTIARVWVADAQSRVVGTVALWPQNAEGSEAFVPNSVDLRHLAVDSSVKGSGVSTALLDTAEAEARALGAAAICLHVRRGADGVRRLYEKRGYVRQASGDLDKLPDIYLEAFVKPLE